MPRKLEGWSREQIASGLRLAASGVPVLEVAQMMDVSADVFAEWKAEYAELFDKLIIGSAGLEQLDNAAKTTGNRRVAYLSGCLGGKEVQTMMLGCKLRYSVIENPATVARELLRSGCILGNFQKPSLSWESFPPGSRSLHQGSSEGALLATNCGTSNSKARLSQNHERAADGSTIGRARMSLMALVSAQIAARKKDLPQLRASDGETPLVGVLNKEIDELRWRMELASGDRIDVPIIEDEGLKFSLDGILEEPIQAIRTFYTSPVDALLMGNLLIKKSESPATRPKLNQVA